MVALKRFFVLFIFLVSILNTSPIYGRIIGNVLSTDIVVFIDSQPIHSYNIDNQTYVIAEDLAGYGFDVQWDKENRTISITLNDGDYERTFLSADEINQLKNDIEIGKILYSVYATDIKTFIEQKAVNAYNIDGKTLIPVSELSVYGDIVWNEVDSQINVRVRLKTLRTQWEMADNKQTIYLSKEDKDTQQYIGQLKDGKPHGIGKIISDGDTGMSTYHDEEYGTFINGVKEGDFYKIGNSHQYTGSNHSGYYISEDYNTYTNDERDGFSCSVWSEGVYHGYRIEGFFKGDIKNGLYRSSEYNPEYFYGFVIQEDGIYIDNKLQDFQEIESDKTSAPKFKYVYAGSSFTAITDEQNNLYSAGDGLYFKRPRFYKILNNVKKLDVFNTINIIKDDNSLYHLEYESSGIKHTMNYKQIPIAENVIHAEENCYLTEDGILHDENGIIAEDVKEFSDSFRLLILKKDGSVEYTKYNEDGTLKEPVKLMDGVKKIHSEGLTSFMIKEDGSLWGIGFNSDGMLLDGKSIRDNSNLTEQSDDTLEVEFAKSLEIPVIKKPICIMENVKDIHSAQNTIAVIDNENRLFAWGNNESNQLMEENTEFISTPKLIMEDVKQVSVGWSHCAVIKNDNSLWVWGSNKNGQLGIGDIDIKSVSSPVQIEKVYQFIDWAD